MGKAEEEAKKIKAAVDSTKETMDELVFATRDFTNEANKAAKAVFDNNTQVAATTKAFRDLSKTAAETAMTFEEISAGAADISAASKLQVKYEQQKKKLAFELKQSLSSQVAKHLDMEKIMKGEETVAGQLKDQFSKMTPEQRKLVKIYHEQFKALQEQDGVMEEMSRNAKNIDKGMGLTGKTLSGLGGVLKKAGLGDIGEKMGLDTAVAEGRKLSAELTNGGTQALGLGGKMKVAGKMIGSVGKSISAAFGPVALIGMALKQIVEQTKKVDAAAGDLAKNLGVSYDEALALGGEFRNMADDFGDVLVRGEDVAKTQAELNKYFGTSVKFSGELSAEMASIQKRTGLSEDSMNFFARSSMISGKTLKKTLKDITKTTLEQNKQKKLMMSAKQVQEAIGKTSALIKINNQGNVQELAKAVMATKALGISMEKLDSIAGNLLDFESSIAAEMEAELLLGKDINLEKARAAALANDEVGLAEALKEQVGTAAEFGSMGRIQQEAIAKAMGMSRTEMADMLYEQENLNALQNAFGDQVNNINDAQAIYNERRAAGLSIEEASAGLADEQLAKQLESASKQEEFNGLIREVQEGFADIGMHVLKIFQGIKDAVGGGKNLLKIVKGIAAAYLIIKGVQIASKALQAGQIAFETTKAMIMGTQAVAATTANAMATFGLGTVIAVAAVATALGVLAGYGLSKMSDGVIGPDGGMIVSGPKGSIQLDKNDSIIAGTNLGGGGGGGENNQRQITLLSEQNSLLRALVNKTSTIEMNSNEVGAELATSERAVQ